MLRPPPGLPARRLRKLQITVYNPCHAVTPDRRGWIGRELYQSDVIALVGTGVRHWDPSGGAYAPRITSNDRFWMMDMGWQPSSMVNKSCGGALYLRKRRFSKPVCKLVCMPPPELRGRAGVVELAGDLRLALGYAYFPWRPLERKQQAFYQHTVDELMLFLRRAFASLHGGVVPLVGIDANDSFGVEAAGPLAGAHDDRIYIGDELPEEEHYAASALRAFCRDHGLCVVDSFFRTAPTFFRPVVLATGSVWIIYCAALTSRNAIAPLVSYCLALGIACSWPTRCGSGTITLWPPFSPLMTWTP